MIVQPTTATPPMSGGVWHRQRRTQLVISEFMSLDGVVQAPGGAKEDTDGGFEHGGRSAVLRPETMGSAIDETAQRTDALLYGRRTWQAGGRVAGPGR